MDFEDPRYWEMLIKRCLSRLFLLGVLRKPVHGYAITKEVRSWTKGCCSPTAGAIYPVLKEMEERGYVTHTTQSIAGRERKVYKLTEKGERVYKAALEAWSRITPSIMAAYEELGGEEKALKTKEE